MAEHATAERFSTVGASRFQRIVITSKAMLNTRATIFSIMMFKD